KLPPLARDKRRVILSPEQYHAPTGLRRVAQPEELQRNFGPYGIDEGADEGRGYQGYFIRQYFGKDDAQWPLASDAGCRHELALFERERLRPQDARPIAPGCEEQNQRNHELAFIGTAGAASQGSEHNGERQAWQDQENVDNQGEYFIDNASKIG